MRICFVCAEYPPAAHGGIGSMVQTLARALVNAGHEVRVVGVYPRIEETRHETDEGVDVWRLATPRGRFGWIEGRRQQFLHVARWARAGEIDLIEIPDWQGWAAFWPKLDVPVVTRLNGSATYFAAEMQRRARWLTASLERRSLRRSDFWCSVSHYTAQRTKALFALPSGPHAVLPNPVSERPRSEWTQRREGMVVFSGTLTEKKGVLPLIDAWRGVSTRFPHATLHLFGKDSVGPDGGSMVAFLQARLSGCDSARVHFHGPVPRERVLASLDEASVAVFPSYAEACAIAPLEAMAAGCPTIGSSLGSGPELLEHGVDSLTVDPNAPDEIESAICRLLEDRTLARQLAESGREKIGARFSIDRLVLDNQDFYRQCVDSYSHVMRTGLVTVSRNESQC